MKNILTFLIVGRGTEISELSIINSLYIYTKERKGKVPLSIQL
ncbi:hypothetical protein [Anaeromonas frigoriresistens]|nr:hypothetical protein [Anaeromonas frigoriresistens]